MDDMSALPSTVVKWSQNIPETFVVDHVI